MSMETGATDRLRDDAGTYRDCKKPLCLLSVIGALAPCAGLAVHILGVGHTACFLASGLVTYGLVSLLEHWLGEDPINPPEEEVPRLETDGYCRAFLYLLLAALWGGFLLNAIFLAMPELPRYEWLAKAMITGAAMGAVLTVSRELGHKKEWLAGKLGLFSSAICACGHFSIERNRGHHRHVATLDEPASSKMGESVYRFMFRELPGAFFLAWDLELERLTRAGKSAWRLDNEVVQGALFTAAVYGWLISSFGERMVPVLGFVALWGAFQLTLTNYIEHYGLVRKQMRDRRHERCQLHYYWNSSYIVSNLIVFHLQRHSDHHDSPPRSYQSLRRFPELPSVQSGYFAMFMAAMESRLSFSLMDKRRGRAVRGHASRINFLPAKRAMLVARFSLHDQASGPSAQTQPPIAALA